ncbi:MAG TPA: LytTR family DNA-binding domain-containing protein [Puia sp.]|jgi:two-component system LytT family response regulator|nr:LytTR family DNA-binding domain-containing protein [Puia sp.]
MLPLIRTILIDDEPDGNRILQTLLENYCPQIKVVGTADGVETGAALIHDTQPDLVFMDIEMNQGNAFDLLNRLRTIQFHIIFVTAFDNHAVRAFRYSAIDYLLKPVNIRELRSAVDKIPRKNLQDSMLDRIKGMLESMGSVDTGDRKIAIPTANGLSFVFLREIIRLEAQGSYTVIHLRGRNRVTATVGIKEYEDLLPDTLFFRIHHSHIISLNMIKSYQKGRGGYVTMDDDSFIEVASRRREAFLQRLLK